MGGINKIPELCPCLWFLKGIWYPSTYFMTFSIAGHSIVVLLGRVDGGREWVGWHLWCQRVTVMWVGWYSL